jgi:long-chain fatty acid transport protein
MTASHASRLCLLLASSLLPQFSFAANGLYLTAYGAEQTGVGGADIAHINDTGSLIANPAGLANIKHSRADYTATGFSIARVAHRDEYNDDVRVSNEWGGVVGGAYAQRLDDTNIVLGGGVNVAGGLGYVYDNINTAFGTVDDVSAMFSLFRFSAGAAWNITDNLRLGIVIATTYATVEQSLFEDTSVTNASQTFFGVKIRDLSGWGGDAKIGMQYDLSPSLTMGINYTSQSKIDLDGGSMTVNYSALGNGRVTYRDVSMAGLETPQEFGIGAHWQAKPDLAIAVEANWFDWAGATRQLKIDASNPDAAAPVNTLSQSSSLKMHSRIVYSLGIEKALASGDVVRAGYSYHSLIIDKGSLSPTFALTPQHDYALGYGTKLNANWLMNIAFAYQPRKSVQYNNTELPFGDSVETNESFSVHFTFSKLP